jgi:chromosome segregation ATPase
MNRFLQYFNFIGIVALAVLCAAQWRTNRRLNLEIFDLDKTRLDQLAKIAEEDKAIKGYVADLDELRQRLTLSEAALKESQEKFAVVATERDKLVTERDALKTSLDKFTAALAERDAALKQAGEQIQKLAADRDEAVAKFNDLADKYNALVKDVEKAKK